MHKPLSYKSPKEVLSHPYNENYENKKLKCLIGNPNEKKIAAKNTDDCHYIQIITGQTPHIKNGVRFRRTESVPPAQKKSNF